MMKWYMLCFKQALADVPFHLHPKFATDNVVRAAAVI